MYEDQPLKNSPKNSTVLITGGSGLVGRHLTSTLLSEGYRVSHLSRKTNYPDDIRVFQWESDPPAGDFLSTTCRLWEEGADLFGNSGARTIKIRTGVVLVKNDSALSKLMSPARFGFLIQAGNGRQYMPWIHIKDLCNIYLKAIKDEQMSGPYNAVSSQHLTHRDFVKILARVMNKPVFPIPIPSLILKAVLGEMSDIVLKGSRVSSEKIVNSGYNFLFNDTLGALRDIICG